MKRALATLAAILAAGYAMPAASQVFWTGSSSYASVAVGGTATFSNLQVQAGISYPTSMDVSLEVTGGCGNFGGATRINVTLPQVSPGSRLYLGVPPPFTATNVGRCTLTAKWSTSWQALLFVDVFDPHTLTVQVADPNYPVVAVAKNTASTAVAARVVDAGGYHAIGRGVRYDPDPRHCALLNGADLPFQGISDETGIAKLPFAIPANAPDGICTLTATLLDNNQQAAIKALVYDVSLATLDVSPMPITAVAGATMSFTFVMRDAAGNPLPDVTFMGRDVTYVGGPGIATGIGIANTTNAAGTAFEYSLPVNSIAGRYDISLYTAGLGFRIPVVQSLSGQPPPAAPPPVTASLQDMWWGGSTQNGWGVSIIEHRDTLFGIIYAYDDVTEASRWFAIPGGTWDDTHTRYTGQIYMPTGSPFQSYDASRFVVGPSVGIATFIFTDSGHVTLDLEMPNNTLNSKFGRIALTRQNFASGSSTLSVGDMWWGGSAQNGWGIAVLQQAGALFAVWFTYGSDGLPTWYVMPTGTWTASDTYDGRMYLTTNYSDWLADYIPDRLKVTDVGPFRFRFSADGTATFTYQIGNLSGTLPLTRQPF